MKFLNFLVQSSAIKVELVFTVLENKCAPLCSNAEKKSNISRLKIRRYAGKCCQTNFTLSGKKTVRSSCFSILCFQLMVDNNSIRYRDRKALTGNTYTPVLLSILCQFIFSYILPTCTVLHVRIQTYWTMYVVRLYRYFTYKESQHCFMFKIPFQCTLYIFVESVE